MLIWTLFAVLTAAVIAVLLLPVVRGGAAPAGDRAAHDRAVFRDQLAELDRDVERGSIGAAEAEGARNEIARRLIAAAPKAAPGGREKGSAALAMVAALLIPAVALPLYLVAGNPQLPDVPLAARMANAEKAGDYEALIVKVETHLASHPDDLQGWSVLAPAYRRSARWSDAAEAHRNIVRLSTPDAQAYADYAEALVMAGQGMVSAEAHTLFGKALALDPRLPKARFYDALALKQEGRAAEAKKAFEAFLADTPADAPWRAMLLAEMGAADSRPPALDDSAMADAANMSEADRTAMIRSMVDGLEQKLAADGADLAGWLRLIRARGVLGEADRARRSYDTARARFKDDPQALARLDGLAKEMDMR